MLGRLRKIGIRLVIDGREREIRESLDRQIINIARVVVSLLEDNLRFPSREKIEYVISDTIIRSVADAARYTVQFEQEGVWRNSRNPQIMPLKGPLNLPVKKFE